MKCESKAIKFYWINVKILSTISGKFIKKDFVILSVLKHRNIVGDEVYESRSMSWNFNGLSGI